MNAEKSGHDDSTLLSLSMAGEVGAGKTFPDGVQAEEREDDEDEDEDEFFDVAASYFESESGSADAVGGDAEQSNVRQDGQAQAQTRSHTLGDEADLLDVYSEAGDGHDAIQVCAQLSQQL